MISCDCKQLLLSRHPLIRYTCNAYFPLFHLCIVSSCIYSLPFQIPPTCTSHAISGHPFVLVHLLWLCEVVISLHLILFVLLRVSHITSPLCQFPQDSFDSSHSNYLYILSFFLVVSSCAAVRHCLLVRHPTSSPFLRAVLLFHPRVGTDSCDNNLSGYVRSLSLYYVCLFLSVESTYRYINLSV